MHKGLACRLPGNANKLKNYTAHTKFLEYTTVDVDKLHQRVFLRAITHTVNRVKVTVMVF